MRSLLQRLESPRVSSSAPLPVGAITLLIAVIAAVGFYTVAAPSALFSIVRTHVESDGSRSRSKAAAHLSAFAMPKWVPTLVTMLTDADSPFAREAAARALGQLDDPAIQAVLLTALRTDEAGGVRAAAAATLGKFQTAEVTAALLAALQTDPETAVREHAVKKLVQSEDPQIKDALLKIWQTEPAGSVREQIALRFMLSDEPNIAEPNIAEPNIADMMFASLQDESPEVRHIAMTSLTESRDPRLLEALLHILATDTEYTVRLHAIRALGKLDDPEALTAIIGTLNPDEGYGIHEVVIDTLAQRGDLSGAAFAEFGEWPVRRIIQIMNDRSPREKVKINAAIILGKLDDAESFAGLLATLNQERFRDARRAAIKALAERREPQVLEVLQQAVYHSDQVIQGLAVGFLVERPEPQAWEAVSAALREGILKNSAIRVAAVKMLSTLEAPHALEAVLAALQDPGWRVREAAAKGLANRRDLPQVAKALEHAQNDESEQVRKAAASAVKRPPEEGDNVVTIALTIGQSAVVRMDRDSLLIVDADFPRDARHHLNIRNSIRGPDTLLEVQKGSTAVNFIGKNIVIPGARKFRQHYYSGFNPGRYIFKLSPKGPDWTELTLTVSTIASENSEKEPQR
jgi:HEAT repeat protein